MLPGTSTFAHKKKNYHELDILGNTICLQKQNKKLERINFSLMGTEGELVFLLYIFESKEFV